MPEAHSIGVEATLEGGVGRIVLDRPRALNALNLEMISRIREALVAWSLLSLKAVTIESSSERAFCAGGDIRQIRQNTLDGCLDDSERFFAAEYDVNHLLGNYPVPVVALIDGLCLGGGLGLSVHGAFRVVTERASMAMPETAIGFFPDVGASHFLPRLPGAVGTYLGLTGARVDGPESVQIGLATHFVSSADIGEIPRLLRESEEPVDAVLRKLSITPGGPTEVVERRPDIDAAFSATTVAGICERLAGETSPWADKTLEVLGGMSPQSLEVTLELLLWGRQRSLRECLDAELRTTRSIVRSDDFIEGVRAALVDKDRTPVWTTRLG